VSDNHTPESSNRRFRLAIGAVLVGATLLAWGGFRYLPFLAQVENTVADLRIAALTPGQPQHPDIVILTVTEDTLAMFPYRSPLDRGILATTIAKLNAAGARHIGLDILFDQATESQKDQVLFAAMANSTVPISVSWVSTQDGLTDKQAKFLENVPSNVYRALPNLASDPADGTVRWIFPGGERNGRWVPGLAYSLTGLDSGPQTKAERLLYRQPPNDKTPTFKSFPLHAFRLLPAPWFKDKIVLVGADLPQDDRHRTPLIAGLGEKAGTLPGVFIHAHGVAQLLDGKAPPGTGTAVLILVIAIGATLGGLVFAVKMPPWAKALITVAVIVGFWVGGFVLYQQGQVLLPLVSPSAAFVLAAGGVTSLFLGRVRAEKKYIRDAFSRFTAPQVVDQMIEDPTKFTVGGERREISVLYSDLAGFTSMIEKSNPAEILPVLNEYLDGMCSIAFGHGGTIDKIVGDAVVVLFNAPVGQDDHRQRAALCAMEFDKFARAFQARYREQGIEIGGIRVGVNSGMVTVGNFGGKAFFDYNAHGDAMNTGARLESVNKQTGTMVCIAEETMKGVDGMRARPIGRLVLKGKTQGVLTFEPVDHLPEEQVAAYEAAYGLLKEEHADAPKAFGELAATYPDDKLVAMHAGRLASGATGETIVLKDK